MICEEGYVYHIKKENRKCNTIVLGKFDNCKSAFLIQK